MRNVFVAGIAFTLTLGAVAGASPVRAAAATSAHRATAPVTSRPAAFEPMLTPMREPGAYGGRFVIAVTNDPRTFNPILAAETNSVDVCERLFTSLTRFDNATQRIRPALAKSWEVSADGLVWTWHLRRGARFSDGQPITAADVKFSFDVANDTSLASPVHDAVLVHGRPMIVSAPDSYTVVTRIDRPFALMEPTVGAVRILPEHVLGAAWRAGAFASAYGVGTPRDSLVTSGPWLLEQYAPHEKVVLARNKYWYGVDARGRRLPYLDRLIFTIVPDQTTAAIQFQAPNSEIDGLDNVKPDDYATYAKGQAAGDYTLHDLGPTLTSSFFWFNLNTVKVAAGARNVGDPYAGAVKYAWFSNPVFRRAVSKAIDRDAMIRAVYFGAGTRSWSVITPGNRVFHNPQAPAYDYDPAGARQLLAGLGWRDSDRDGVLEDAHGNPVKFTLETNANSAVRVALANFVRDDLAKVGIGCTIAPVAFNSMMAHITNDFGYDAELGGLGGSVPPDPGVGPNFYLSSGSTHFWNVGQLHPETPEEARIDSLFDRLVTVRDMVVRKRLSAKIEQIIGDQGWVVWLPVQDIRLPIRNRFGNLDPSPIRHRLLWNIESVYVKPKAAQRR